MTAHKKKPDWTFTTEGNLSRVSARDVQIIAERRCKCISEGGKTRNGEASGELTGTAISAKGGIVVGDFKARSPLDHLFREIR